MRGGRRASIRGPSWQPPCEGSPRSLPPKSGLTMSGPKILVIPGSLRSGSHNVRLAALATKELVQAEADVTRISLVDYPLPIFDADTAQDKGPPPNAVKLKQMMSAHQGV